jgi:hypothetical protein
MVGAINPNASTPLSTQQQLARNSAYMLNPGEPFPQESPLPSNMPSPSAAVAQNDNLGPGAIAGIVVAALSVLLLASLLFFLWGRTKTLRHEVERNDSSVKRKPRPSTSSTANMLHTTPETSLFPPQQQLQLQLQQHFAPPTPRGELESTQFSPQLNLDQKHPTSPPQGHPALFPTRHTPIATFPGAYPAPTAYHSSPNTRIYTPNVEGKLGPYGHQELVTNASAGAAPPYGFHVNSSAGPVEVEGACEMGGSWWWR